LPPPTGFNTILVDINLHSVTLFYVASASRACLCNHP
jgi:hypothetical protein